MLAKVFLWMLFILFILNTGMALQDDNYLSGFLASILAGMVGYVLFWSGVF